MGPTPGNNNELMFVVSTLFNEMWLPAYYEAKWRFLRHNKQEVKNLNPYFSHLRGT